MTTFGYSPKANKLFFGCGNSGVNNFHEAFDRSHTAPLSAQENGRIVLHAIVDKASVELFANDGTVVISEQFFAKDGAFGLELFVEHCEPLVHSLKLTELNIPDLE